MGLLRDVKEVGGRHIAIMSHLSHYRELSTKKVQDAIHRLKQEGGVIIRSQSPIMAGINDDAAVWSKKWKEEVRLGIIPYYMFIARDTGAQEYFNVPLVRAHKLYAEAIRSTSGLCRTARGPSMSCTPGKVEVCGVQNIMGTEAFVLRFLQCPTTNGSARSSSRSSTRKLSGSTISSRSPACRCPGRKRASRALASPSLARWNGWTSSSHPSTRWSLASNQAGIFCRNATTRAVRGPVPRAPVLTRASRESRALLSRRSCKTFVCKFSFLHWDKGVRPLFVSFLFTLG